jgi:hypothetical protein
MQWDVPYGNVFLLHVDVIAFCNKERDNVLNHDNAVTSIYTESICIHWKKINAGLLMGRNDQRIAQSPQRGVTSDNNINLPKQQVDNAKKWPLPTSKGNTIHRPVLSSSIPMLRYVVLDVNFTIDSSSNTRLLGQNQGSTCLKRNVCFVNASIGITYQNHFYFFRGEIFRNFTERFWRGTEFLHFIGSAIRYAFDNNNRHWTSPESIMYCWKSSRDDKFGATFPPCLSSFWWSGIKRRWTSESRGVTHLYQIMAWTDGYFTG